MAGTDPPFAIGTPAIDKLVAKVCLKELSTKRSVIVILARVGCEYGKGGRGVIVVAETYIGLRTL